MRDRGADLDGTRGLGLFGSRSPSGDVVGVGQLSRDINAHVPLDRDAADGCLTANSETKVFLIVFAGGSPSHTEHDRSPEVANDAASASCVADTASSTPWHKPAYFVIIGRSGLEGG